SVSNCDLSLEISPESYELNSGLAYDIKLVANTWALARLGVARHREHEGVRRGGSQGSSRTCVHYRAMNRGYPGISLASGGLTFATWSGVIARIVRKFERASLRLMVFAPPA